MCRLSERAESVEMRSAVEEWRPNIDVREFGFGAGSNRRREARSGSRSSMVDAGGGIESGEKRG